MINKSSLEIFLKNVYSSSNSYRVSNVSTVPKYQMHVKKTMNELLEENEDWIYTISMLLSYKLVIWAKDKRKMLSINLEDVLSHNSDYFGVPQYIKLEHSKKNLADTEALINLLDQILHNPEYIKNPKEQYSLKVAHSLESGVQSEYYFKMHYKNALKHVCSSYNARIKKIILDMNRERESLDIDFRNVYQDTDRLVRLLPIIDANIHKETSNIDLLLAYHDLNNCIKALSDFPLADAELMENVIELYAEGMTSNEISVKLKKSRGYVCKLCNRGLLALSMIIFGYCDKDVANSMFFE